MKKKAAIQLMGSRLWGRFNPDHWDPVEVWAQNGDGEKKTVGEVEVDVDV